MDADDGLEDGNIDLQYVAVRPNSWDIDTRQLAPIGDMDGDGGDDLLAARVDSRGPVLALDSPGRGGALGLGRRSLAPTCPALG